MTEWPKNFSRTDGEWSDSGMFLRRKFSERGWGASPFTPPNPLERVALIKQQIESYLSGDLERQNREEGENILFQIEEFESAFNQGDVAAVGEFGIQIGAAYTRLQVTTVFEPEVRKKRNSSAGPSSRKGKSQSELWKWVREQKDWRTASPVALHKQAEARVEKIELDSFRRRLATLRKRAKVSDH